MSPYVGHRDSYGRREKFIDEKALARDLAAALGGEVDRQEEGYDRGFTMPDGLRVFVSSRGYGAELANNRASISASAPALTQDYGLSSWGVEMPSIKVDVTRPLESLVKDVRKRVIEAAAEPCAVLAKRAAEYVARRGRLLAHVEALRAFDPAMAVKVRDNPNLRADFDFDVTGLRLRGWLTDDGQVIIERVVAQDVAHALAIISAVMGKNPLPTGG